jgi:LPXTG-motif cell wall-anchored protein
VQPFSLVGTNPLNCNLLIIAGPAKAFFEPELEKIDNYLAQGGRVMVLLNNASINKENGQERTGLDKVLAKWGVQIGNVVIEDEEHRVQNLAVQNMLARNFNSLLGSSGGLFLIKPRPVGKAKSGMQTADAPRVDDLVFTGDRAVAVASNKQQSKPQTFPLAVAVEKGAIQGVITERGATRLVVVGESFFLCDGVIESASNRDFAAAAIEWLVNRAQLLEGIGPRPIKAYRIIMSHSQWQKAQWLLLAGLPGGVLAFGGLVWLRRRK